MAFVAAGGTRRGRRLWRSTLRTDCTPVLGSRSCCRTHCAHFVRCVQIAAASQFTKRALRADLEPRLAGRAGPGGPAVRQAQTVLRTVCVRAHLLVATDSAPAGYPLPRSHRCGFSWGKQRRCSKGAFGQVAARLWSAEKRRARGLARSASCQLTRRRCLNGANEESAVSSATGPRDRASQGSRCAAPTAPAKRCSLPERAFAAQTVARPSIERRTRVTQPMQAMQTHHLSGMSTLLK